ncbi:hypothetical protein AAMO2058_000993200 [Amorphochlora amoebiformis]
MDQKRWEAKFTPMIRRLPKNKLKELCAPFNESKDIALLGGGLPNQAMFPLTSIGVELAGGGSINIKGFSPLRAAMQYNGGGIPGYKPFLKELVDREINPYGECDKDWDVTPCAGSSDALSKTFRIVVEEGDVCFLEDHCYGPVLSLLTGQDACIRGVKGDSNGIVPSQLEAACQTSKKEGKRLKLIYLVPAGGNPTGAFMPVQRLRDIYKIAQKYDLIIVEDNPYEWLRYNSDLKSTCVPGLKLGGFKPFDADKRVIRIDTVSKFLAPGFRSGWVTAPKPFISQFNKLSNLSSHSGCALSQAIVMNILKQWGAKGLRDHVQKVQQFYQKRRNIVALALDKHVKGLCEWSVPQAGMFFWIKPTVGVKNLNSEGLMPTLLKHKVLLVPGSIFSAADANSPYFRLAFSYASEKDLTVGVRKLGEVLRDVQNSKTH